MPYIHPIGGGKGGVGKSFITANIGTLLARMGKKVILVDLDLGGSNLHTFFGVNRSQNGIQKFLNKEVNNLNETAISTPVPNLYLISSMNCSMEIANLFAAQKQKIIRALKRLEYDYVLLDLGAGTHFNTLDFFSTSDTGIFIFTPEPTSVENAFRFIKSVYVRNLKQILKQKAFNSVVKAVNTSAGDEAVKARDIIDEITKYDAKKGEMLQTRLGELKFRFILNQFRKNIDATLGEKIEKICNRHFYSDFSFMGNISFDERVHESIFHKDIYIEKYPYTATAMELNAVAEKIIIS